MKKLIIALTLVALPGLAWSQDNEGTLTKEQFEHMDTNRDGRISESEYRAFMEEAFDDFDTDGNGYLTPQETEHILTPEQFASVDADENGKITRQEFMDAVMADFHRQDLDGDGYLAYD